MAITLTFDALALKNIFFWGHENHFRVLRLKGFLFEANIEAFEFIHEARAFSLGKSHPLYGPDI